MPVGRFHYEQALLKQGITCFAGVDEVGRGPLAGPVVAAAVLLPVAWIEGGMPPLLEPLNDSKQLTAKQREEFCAFLTSCDDVAFGLGVVDVDIIDTINILQATHRAMNEALAQLAHAPAHVLVDGLRVASLKFPQTAIVGGDAKSYSIAAASVIAKVTRDRMMVEYDLQYPAYGFAGHKGYGTAHHLAALQAHGPCPIHRRSFAPLRQPDVELFR